MRAVSIQPGVVTAAIFPRRACLPVINIHHGKYTTRTSATRILLKMPRPDIDRTLQGTPGLLGCTGGAS